MIETRDLRAFGQTACCRQGAPIMILSPKGSGRDQQITKAHMDPNNGGESSFTTQPGFNEPKTGQLEKRKGNGTRDEHAKDDEANVTALYIAHLKSNASY